MMEDEKFYIVKSINLPFVREYSIYNNWLFSDKTIMLDKIKEDLENEVLLEPVKLELNGDWIYVNDSPDKWLKIEELIKV